MVFSVNMSVNDKTYNIPFRLVQELKELSEISDTQDVIKASIAFYLKCLRYRADGNIILCTPFRVTKQGIFEVDPSQVDKAIIIAD